MKSQLWSAGAEDGRDSNCTKILAANVAVAFNTEAKKEEFLNETMLETTPKTLSRSMYNYLSHKVFFTCNC